MALTVAFEGIPGCGKTTVIQLLVNDLANRGFKVEIADIDTIGHAPALHAIARTYPFGHPARIILYWALRLHQYDVMQEMLNKTDIILADRFWNSTFVFDVCGNGISREFWKWFGRHVKRQPDITLFFEAPLGVVQQRKKVEIMSDPDFAQRVKQGYSELADKLSWTRVDATRELVEVKNNCMEIILSNLQTRSGDI